MNVKRKRLEKVFKGIRNNRNCWTQLMALPEIKASDKVDCSPDSIKIVLSIRALISVANYNYVQSEGEEKEGRERDVTWPWREFMSATQKNSRPPREDPIPGSRVSTTIHERGPSRRQWTSNRSFSSGLSPSSLRPFPPSLPLCPSVCLSIYRSFPVTAFFDSSLSFFTLKGRKKKENFINLRQDGWPSCRTVSSSRFT